MTDPLLSIAGLTKRYPNTTNAGVTNINFSITKGTITAIVGESGSEKSTLLKLIYGTLDPDEGSLLFAGEPILGPSKKLIPGHPRMKLVAQDFQLNTYAKVYDNVSSMLSNTDLKSKHQKTMEMLEFLNIDHLAEKRAVELSGGEQQRVALARAVITEPELLLLDEPFSQVDAILRKQLRNDVRRLARYLGITVVIVSHDPEDGLSLADHMLILKNPNLLQQGEPKTLIKNPYNAYVGLLLGNANVLKATAAKDLLDLDLSPSECLIVYPHQIQISENGIPGTIKQVNFKLIYEEIEVQTGSQLIVVVVSPGIYRVGDTVSLQFTDYAVTTFE